MVGAVIPSQLDTQARRRRGPAQTAGPGQNPRGLTSGLSCRFLVILDRNQIRSPTNIEGVNIPLWPTGTNVAPPGWCRQIFNCFLLALGVSSKRLAGIWRPPWDYLKAHV